MSKYLDELRLRMQSQTVDILALSETHLDSTFTDSAVSIEGYTLVRRDRCRSGGGVAMYIRNIIDYKIRSDLSDPDLEFLCFEIQKSKAKSFLLQTGTDPRIQQLSYLISSRPFWEILKRKMLNQIKYTRRYQL